MWLDLLKDLKKNELRINIIEAHIFDDRDGRYKRAIENLGLALAKGDAIAFSEFSKVKNRRFEVAKLVIWYHEDWSEYGLFYVFEMFYSYGKRKNKLFGRDFLQAEILAYYDGLQPNPGKPLSSKKDALEYLSSKGGFYECRTKN